MPKEGFKSVTVSEELYKKLEKIAKKTFRTVPSVIEYLLKNNKEA